MPHGTKANELMLFKRLNFQPVDPALRLDMHAIQARQTEVIFERHSYYPMDYFFFAVNGVNFFGRKTVSTLYLSGQQHIKKCNQIKAHMILGMVLRHQTTEKGIIIYHKPLANNEKLFLFNEMKSDPKIDIYYPFPVLDKSFKEHVQSGEAWDTSEDLATELNIGEEHIRQYTNTNLLKQFDMNGKKVYDPACSTGKFLDSIKEAYPNAIVIGQDMNPDMVAFAKKHSRIDELHVGSALYPCVEKESVDFIFIRFLNLSVVTTDQALKLFCKLAQCCKENGSIIVFGFTPVLLSAQIFELLNLEIKQTTAYSKEYDSVFQYYVLQKRGPVPMMRYENYSLFKLPSAQFAELVPNIQREKEKPEPVSYTLPRSKL